MEQSLIMSLKTALKKTGIHLPVRWVRRKLWAMQLSGKDNREIFTEIYNDNKWQCDESISGPGSTIEETAHLRAELEQLFAELNVKTIIDAPCGDYNWFKEIKTPFDQYIGYDIVEPLIEEDNKKYKSDSVRFECKNILEEPLADADLFFCRDLFLHLATDDIFKLFRNLKKSNITWLLGSHAIGFDNTIKIHTGQSRQVDLTATPFNFPQPEKLIIEQSNLAGGIYKESRTMGLWKVKDIPDF